MGLDRWSMPILTMTVISVSYIYGSILPFRNRNYTCLDYQPLLQSKDVFLRIREVVQLLYPTIKKIEDFGLSPLQIERHLRGENYPALKAFPASGPAHLAPTFTCAK